MNKALIFVLAFGAVAFAAPDFSALQDAAAPQGEVNDQHDLSNVEKRNVDTPALDGALEEDHELTAKDIEKRHAIITYPSLEYDLRFGYPYRYGLWPQQRFFAPAAYGITYPFRNLLSYVL